MPSKPYYLPLNELCGGTHLVIWHNNWTPVISTTIMEKEILVELPDNHILAIPDTHNKMVIVRNI